MLARFEGEEYRGVYDSINVSPECENFVYPIHVQYSMIQSKTKKSKKIFFTRNWKNLLPLRIIKEVASGINFIVPQKGHLKFSIIQGQNWYFSSWEASASDKLVSSVCLARTTVAQINVGFRTSRFD